MEAQVGHSNVEGGKAKESGGTSTKNILKNWQLMSSIILYCIFCLRDTAYLEVISSYMILRVTSLIIIQYEIILIILLWPLKLPLSCQ